MSGPVFANGMEISCKSMGGKSICQFPDICFTPPQTPATPMGVPIPYPNTGMATDTTKGSRTVKIKGKEVMLKDRSYFKKSIGDEAGCAPKKGIINSKHTGKVYFAGWSMNVKFEGENVVRHLDLTTHNHASPPNGAAPMVHTATMAMENIATCAGDLKNIKDSCKDDVDPCPGPLAHKVGEQRANFTATADQSRTVQAANAATSEAKSNDCVKHMRCHLRPYEPDDKKGGCCPGQSPHHIPPKTMLKSTLKDYNENTALCVCLEGASQHVGSHGEHHAALDYIASKPGKLDAQGKCTLKDYNKICAQATAAQTGCDEECIEAQLNNSFPESEKSKKVKHYQSDSKQLSTQTKSKIDTILEKENISRDD